MRHIISDDKDRTDQIICEVGGTYKDHRPLYMKPDVWSRLSEYWMSDTFKRRSEASKAARAKVKVPHTSGARSFDSRRRVR